MDDIPPPPFKTEELDSGPSWGCLIGLFSLGVIVTILTVLILSVS